MLKLNVGFTKKIGEANYGSRGATVNPELELNSAANRQVSSLSSGPFSATAWDGPELWGSKLHRPVSRLLRYRSGIIGARANPLAAPNDIARFCVRIGALRPITASVVTVKFFGC
ncbi:MAG: hypothetical protein K8U03_22145 [Planctomycetia bacterium]|nr:hypothetical protein [Planctomycetia bacterium]